jgi:hypothetical protein
VTVTQIVCVAGQALSGTSLLITPCDGLHISSARMLNQYNIHSLLIFLSTIPALNRATVCYHGSRGEDTAALVHKAGLPERATPVIRHASLVEFGGVGHLPMEHGRDRVSD